MFQYAAENYQEIVRLLKDHLLISLVCITAASLIGITGGYFASKSGAAEKAAVSAFSVLRVIPSLAILVLLIPVFGTGFVPAAFALTILAIPPVLLNTIAGFRDVPPFLIECAEGIGMNEKQILRKVKIPQALPMILAGIRTGLVEIIASATLAAKIGASGLGELIFTGLGLYRMDILVVGGVAVAVLSLLGGIVFDSLVKLFIPYLRRRNK